jgi:hypothetical protein
VSEQLALVEASQVVAAYAATYPNVEVWPDDYIEDGWEYFSVMSIDRPVHRKLAYVRVKNGCIERRTYDSAGDDLWLATK